MNKTIRSALLLAISIIIGIASVIVYMNSNSIFPHPSNGKVYCIEEPMTITKITKSSSSRKSSSSTQYTLYLQPEDLSAGSIKITKTAKTISYDEGDTVTVYYTPINNEYSLSNQNVYTDDPNHPDLMTEEDHNNYTKGNSLRYTLVTVICLVVMFTIIETIVLINTLKKK